MRFSITAALAAFPFLVGAVPVHNSRDNLLSIPLSKRWLSQLSDNDGEVPNIPHNSREKSRRGSEVFERNTGKRRSDNSSAPGNISLTAINPTFLWSGTIQVGTPGKEYSVLIDTGTADLMLFGPSCPTCQGHNTYDPSKSSSANDLKTPFNLTYGFGNIVGDVFTDSVTIGGFEVSNGTLGVTSEIGLNYNATNFGADGVLGMGFQGLSLYNSSSVIETLLIVGGRDGSRYSGDLVYTPVDTGNLGFWHTELDDITINGNNTHITTLGAVIDSGSPLILGDRESIANIYAGIPGSSRLNVSAESSENQKQFQFWTYPCNTTVNASIVISKTSFNIPSDGFNYTTIGGGLCTGIFAELAAEIAYPGFWVLGNAFLRNVYTEFDYGKLQIGFGQLA
ncbi:aspartic peptidase domain-containing protein [Russula vinacea]|nr:aspartic peptidase domain-containing protein [Russula vinacea]